MGVCVCVCVCDYRIAAAFGHWLRLKSDGGHSLTIRVNYIMQRNQQKTQLYSRGGKEGEKEKRTATASISVPSGGVRLRGPTTQPSITQKLLHTQQRLAHAQQCCRF